jgi:hypothetical protein
LPQASEGMEVCVVDGRVGSYLGMVGHIPMRELTANDIGVFGEGSKGRGHDFNVIRDAWVVISASQSIDPSSPSI